MAAAFTVLGALVVSRQPRNPVGWLLVLIGFFFMYIAASNEVYTQVVLTGGDTTGVNAYVAWAGNWAWLFCMVPAGTLLPLLFPTGRPLTPRWRWVVWLAVAGIGLSFVGSAFTTGPLDGALAVDNPLGIDSPVIGFIGGLGGICMISALLLSIPSLVLRFRRSSGVERQQIKWVASAAALILIVVLPGLSFGGEAGWPLVLIALLIVAIAVTISMLRYPVVRHRCRHQQDRGVRGVGRVHHGCVCRCRGGSGCLLPVGEGNLGLAIAATALVAVAFEPVRVRVQHSANRLVYGRRATPYEALAAMTGKLGESADPGICSDRGGASAGRGHRCRAVGCLGDAGGHAGAACDRRRRRGCTDAREAGRQCPARARRRPVPGGAP